MEKQSDPAVHDSSSDGELKSEETRKLHRLHAELRNTRNEVLNLLITHSGDDIVALRFRLFSTICDGIYSSAKKYHKIDFDFPFYFWPGYDSIAEKYANSPRIQLPLRSLQKDLAPGGVENYCGISPCYPLPPGAKESPQWIKFMEARRKNYIDEAKGQRQISGLFSHRDGVRVLANPTSLFYNVLLFREPVGEDGFIPGSTHRWMAEVASFNRQTGAKRHIAGMLVCYQPEAGPGQVAKYGSDAYLFCPCEELDDVGPNTGVKLDNQFSSLPGEGVGKRPRWPIKQYGLPSERDDEFTELRRELYTPWLMAVFRPDVVSDVFAKVRALVDGNKNLLGYMARGIDSLENGMQRMKEYPDVVQFITNWSKYRFWYTLAFDQAPGRAMTRKGGYEAHTLGTAMLFTGNYLGSAFLSTLRVWLEEMLLLIRQRESMAEAKASGIAQAKRDSEVEETKTFGLIRRDVQNIIRQAAKLNRTAENIRDEIELGKEGYLEFAQHISRRVFASGTKTLYVYRAKGKISVTAVSPAAGVAPLARFLPMHSASDKPEEHQLFSDSLARLVGHLQIEDRGKKWLHRLVTIQPPDGTTRTAFNLIKTLLYRTWESPACVWEVQLLVAVRTAVPREGFNVGLKIGGAEVEFRSVEEVPAFGAWFQEICRLEIPERGIPVCNERDDEALELPKKNDLGAADLLSHLTLLCKALDDDGTKAGHLARAEVVVKKDGAYLRLDSTTEIAAAAFGTMSGKKRKAGDLTLAITRIAKFMRKPKDLKETDDPELPGFYWKTYSETRKTSIFLKFNRAPRT